MPLRIDIPYIEGPVLGTNVSQMSQYTFSGNFGRKFFRIYNDDVPFSSTTVTFTLSLTGGTGGYAIFPEDAFSPFQCEIQLNGEESTVFSVDFDTSLGSASGALLQSTTAVYGPTASDPIMGLSGPTGPGISFSSVNNTVETRRELGSLFCRGANGEYLVKQAGSEITQDEDSFGLARTNPKLTGNVKITVDSVGDIWLNSIDAVKELSDDRFKKYRIGRNGSYAADVFKFFDYGVTPPELVFSLFQADSQYTSTKRSLSEQYDRFYQYGVTQLNSKFYGESFSFFAPIYLKKEIPEYFVIFKTPGPINGFSYDTAFDNWKDKVTSDILDSSRIVKVFSLKEGSAIGSYIRNIVNHPSRTETDLTVSYQQNGYTTFNGVSYTKGSFVQAGELLYDYVNEENPLSSVEEFITQGFERNKVLSSHVINLEFLFDDETADNYSINRYFGLFVNSVDLATFTISEGGLQAFSLGLNQLPLPRKGVDGSPISQKSFFQTRQGGTSIFIDSESIERISITDPENEFSSVVTELTYDLNYGYANLPGNFTQRLSVGDLIIFSTVSGLTATAICDTVTYEDHYTIAKFSLADFISTSNISLYSTFDLTCNFFTQEKYDAFNKKIFDNQFIEGVSRFFYVKDNDDFLHSVKSTVTKSYNLDPFTSKEVIQLNLKEEKTDISSFGGFTDLLTQSECKVLDSRGRSSLSMEFSSYLEPNDYLEVSWDPGPTAEAPLRWRVVANSTGTNPGESWPAYTLTSDFNGDYYLAYFNPGDSSVFLKDFVKSIEDAFNRFPFKNFEVLAKDTNLHFRSTQDGILSENSKVKISIASANVKIMGIDVPLGSNTVNFIGGSNRNFTRGRLDADVARGMLKTEYVSTKGGFSPLEINTVLGKEIVFAPYLEEPVYDEAGEKLIDFTGVNDYLVVGLRNEDQPIQLTSDGKLTTYELFQPTFGILSVMPVKDFDTDFFYSDYTKSYLPELIEYFSRFAPPAKVTTLTSGTPDQVQFDRDFEFSSYPVDVPFLKIDPTGNLLPVLFNDNIQLRFNSAGATADILYLNPPYSGAVGPTVGETLLLMPGNKGTYFSDLELAKFKGFLSLSGVVSSQDEQEFQVLENLWDPTRFTFQLLGSEYDRLAENYLKTLVLKSRVVPYITKWVSPQGKDVRDNPYRFNYHRSFGNMGFSPSPEQTTADPRFHTHEWPYLDSVPDQYPIAEFPEFAFSYMFDQISSKYDFSSIGRDWFTAYFATGYPTELYKDSNGDYVDAKIDPSERYSFFNYQDYDDTTETLFRGYKFRIKELDSNGAPVNLSEKYNNYKFSAIMEMEEDSSFDVEEPIRYNLIVNEKWKFVVLKITVKTSSYRYCTGRMKYVDLYTLSDNDEIVEYTYYNSNASTLSSYSEAVPIDRKLIAPINFGVYSSDPNLPPLTNYFDTTLIQGGDFYQEDLREEIVPLRTGSYSRVVAVYSIFPTIYLLDNVSEVVAEKTLKLSGISCSKKDFSSPFTTIFGIPAIENWLGCTNYHMCGGDGSYAGIRDRLTFSSIIDVLNESGREKMIISIYREDGSSQVSYSYATAGFTITTVKPEALTRIYDYYPVNDNDKPQEFYNIPEIGSILELQKDLQTLYRYQGNFSPKFNDTIKFWLREDELFTNIASLDFLLMNTRIGTELNEFSLVKNQYYSKVADTEVLSLAESSGYQPVYPLIGEISIDKKNLFAWSSSWDSDYYRKYTSTIDFSSVKGTEEMKELKSLFGSKAMKVPEQYDLYEFNLFEATSSNLSPFSERELAYYEDTNNAYLRVNVYNRLMREMMGTSTDLRAREIFLEVANSVPGTFDITLLNDYVSSYLRKNILDLYEIEDIFLYVLQTGNPGGTSISTLTTLTQQRPLIEYTPIGIEKYSLSEALLINKKYIAKKDSSVKTLGNLSFEITYPLDSRYFTSLSIGVKVRRI
jgi:hypothetical protein